MPRFNYRQRFRSTSDASMRHRGTFIGIRQPDSIIKPYYVQDVVGEASNPGLELQEVNSSRTLSVYMGDSNVVMERPEVGMSNLICGVTRKTFAVWHESTARRQIKRSLDFNFIDKHIIGKAEARGSFSHSISNSSGISKHKTLDAFYNDRYPRYTECLASISQGRNVSMAFSKRFALCVHPRCGVVLYYKNTIVGYVVEVEPVLLPQFEYLAETLEESSYAFE